jgi:hypothetical protein
MLAELLAGPDKQSGWRMVLGMVIRARAELTVITVLVTVYILLRLEGGMSAQWALITETATSGCLCVVRGIRARMWAVSDRHRVYKCFKETRTMTPSGTMPYLLWSSPSPVGERIRVWLPAGLSVNNVDVIVAELAAACYAVEARVEENERFSHLVVITIVRRDPFTGKRLSPDYRGHVPTKGSDGAFAPLPDRSTLIVPTPPSEHPSVAAMKGKRGHTNGTSNSGATTKTTTNNKPNTPPPVVGVGGTDVSDYV